MKDQIQAVSKMSKSLEHLHGSLQAAAGAVQTALSQLEQRKLHLSSGDLFARLATISLIGFVLYNAFTHSQFVW